MTEAELSQYRLIKNEIEDLSFRITQLNEKEAQVSTDKVKGSSKYYPYIEQHWNVTGVDQEEYHNRQTRIIELQRKRERKLSELVEKEHELHSFIYSILDSELRQIFTMRFIDGYSQEHIGKKLHLDRSTISKKISKYLDG